MRPPGIASGAVAHIVGESRTVRAGGMASKRRVVLACAAAALILVAVTVVAPLAAVAQLHGGPVCCQAKVGKALRPSEGSGRLTRSLEHAGQGGSSGVHDRNPLTSRRASAPRSPTARVERISECVQVGRERVVS